MVNIRASEEYIEGDDRQYVDKEPSLDILFTDNLSISYQKEIVIKNWPVENHQYIYQEADINEAVNNDPSHVVVFNQCQSVRHSHTREHQDHSDVDVPDTSEWVVWVDQESRVAVLPLLEAPKALGWTCELFVVLVMAKFTFLI